MLVIRVPLKSMMLKPFIWFLGDFFIHNPGTQIHSPKNEDVNQGPKYQQGEGEPQLRRINSLAGKKVFLHAV